MHAPIRTVLVAGLSVAGIGTAVAADSDPCVWRWYVTNALRGQQGPPLQEGRAAAVDSDSGFIQRHERYFADGSPIPSGDIVRR